MPWQVQIHHIDVDQGDSTLIRVRSTENPPVHDRSVLIDGGRLGRTETVSDYLNAEGIHRLTAMVATHYDADHFNGLRGLLSLDFKRFDHTLIYDQGEPGNLDVRGNRVGTPDDPFLRYEESINVRGRRIRVTKGVASNYGVNPPPDWRRAHWLLNKEILWAEASRFDDTNEYDPNGQYRRVYNQNVGRRRPAQSEAVHLPPAERHGSDWNDQGIPVDVNGNSRIPANAPTLRCIATNQMVLNQHDAAQHRAAGLVGNPERQKNEKSLAFVLTFNGFRYYIGGDLETTQEKVVQLHLNPNNNAAGRISVAKLSHHGSEFSSSRAFMDRLGFPAAVISCGLNNSHDHPHQQVINNLEAAYAADNTVAKYYYLTNHRTGLNLGKGGRVAGTNRGDGGHIVVEINQGESQHGPPAQFRVRYTDPNGLHTEQH